MRKTLRSCQRWGTTTRGVWSTAQYAMREAESASAGESAAGPTAAALALDDEAVVLGDLEGHRERGAGEREDRRERVGRAAEEEEARPEEEGGARGRRDDEAEGEAGAEAREDVVRGGRRGRLGEEVGERDERGGRQDLEEGEQPRDGGAVEEERRDLAERGDGGERGVLGELGVEDGDDDAEEVRRRAEEVVRRGEEEGEGVEGGGRPVGRDDLAGVRPERVVRALEGDVGVVRGDPEGGERVVQRGVRHANQRKQQSVRRAGDGSLKITGHRTERCH